MHKNLNFLQHSVVLALTEEGKSRVFCFGSNTHGQCGGQQGPGLFGRNLDLVLQKFRFSLLS